MDSIMVEIAAGSLATAARGLMLAGRWAQAAELLAVASTASDSERAVLAVADAEVAVDQDFWCRTDRGSPALSRATAAVASAPADPELSFDVEFLRLRHDYAAELFGPDGCTPRFGPSGRDAGVIEDLAARAARLRAAAPDAGRAAAVIFYTGLIDDNLRGDPVAAGWAFSSALAEAEEAGDTLTVSEALRHLGYQASEAGDADQARQMWERSREQRQQTGAVPFVLSQQLLLAGLARDAADPAGARAVALEVHHWARALGIGILESGAAEIAGVGVAEPS
jgi:hypothetical protein